MKKRTAAVLAAFLIPYITTLAVSGRVQGADGGKIGGNSDRTSGWESQTDGRKILLDREDGGRNNGTGYAVPLEEYLIGLTAVQIPDGYPKEAVKAQAILARTALYREMDGADSIEESAHLLPSVRHMRTLQEGRIVPSIRSISQKRTVFPSFSASFLSLSVTVHAYVPSNGICRGFALNTANSCCHHVFLRHFRFQKCLPMNSNQKSIKMSIRFFPTLAFTASGNFPC